MNKSYEKATGYKSKDWIGKQSIQADKLTKEDMDLLRKNMQKRASGIHVKPYEIAFMDETNHLKHYELNAKKIEFRNQPSILVVFRDVTRRKATEKRLKEHSARMEALVNEKVKEIKENAEKLRLFFDSSPDAISVTDQKGNLIDCNETAFHFFGYSSKSEVRKINIFDFIPTHRKELALQFINEVEKTGCVKNYKAILMNRYGKEFPAEISASVLKEPNKGNPCFVIITKDISERKKLEDDLIASEEKFRVMSTAAVNAILLVDEDYRITYWNPAAERIFGYTAQEITGQELSRLLPSNIRKRHKRFFNAAIHDKEKPTGMVGAEAVKKDGTLFPVEILATCVQIKNKENALCVIQDVSVRKKMEAEIQQERDLLEKVTGNMGAGLTIIDRNYRIIWANEYLKQVNGNQIENKPCFTVYNKRDSVCLDCGVKRLFETGKPNSHDYIFKGINGDILCAELIVSPLKDKKGKVVAALELAVDVTEKRRMQNQLKEHSMKLEKLVEERTRQLKETQAKLVESERLAAIGELAAMVGHDLRNPLTGMKAATYYLKIRGKFEENSKTKEMLSMIDGCIDQANKIVNDLLEYSRVMKLDLAEVNPDELIKQSLSGLITPKGIKINLQLNAQKKITADEEKLNRVVLNIIKNAFDAMPNGGALTINSEQTAEKMTVTFADTGVGMSKDTLSKLGNPLFTTKAKGMGFGVPICKRVIEAHGGKFLIESAPGKGTTISMEIPIKPKRLEENITLIANNIEKEKITVKRPAI